MSRPTTRPEAFTGKLDYRARMYKAIKGRPVSSMKTVDGSGIGEDDELTQISRLFRL